MAETSTSEGPFRATASIVAGEVEQFAKLADDWWDPDGASAMLHKLNPVRLAYIRDRVHTDWALDEHSRRPRAGAGAGRGGPGVVRSGAPAGPTAGTSMGRSASTAAGRAGGRRRSMSAAGPGC